MSAEKEIAGFHILMILSHVDGNFSFEESQVAAKYVSKHFNGSFEMEKETAFLNKLKKADYFNHFKSCMDQFYRTSSPHERAGMVKFAVEMVKADRKITREENIYLNELLNSWEPEHAG